MHNPIDSGALVKKPRRDDCFDIEDTTASILNHNFLNSPLYLPKAPFTTRGPGLDGEYGSHLEHPLSGPYSDGSAQSWRRCATEDIERLSPLGRDHIKIQGHYPFTLADEVQRGGFLPLRDWHGEDLLQQ